jgi:polyisoprenyl-teichoic acid--peptidoglycan teichoic acid transferase
LTRAQICRRTLQVLGLLILSVSLTGIGTLYYLGHLWSGRRQVNPVAQTREFFQAAFHPEELFPGQTRLTILCMGLDRNWTNQNMPYTKNARTDSMIAVSLDLDSKQVSALSIPRDLRVEIPDHGYHKINDAHRLGGVPLVLGTIQQFLGVGMDYYVIVKLDAVRRFVDAIGGLTVDVEKDMDYDDNWGHLHIHLKKGVQHLNGEQVEGYMRFRHDAESDFGRMRRQQQVIRTLLATLQSPGILPKVPSLIDAFSESVDTNLRREQIMGLASMFHQIRPEEVVTETLPGRDRMADGMSYLEPIEKRTETLVEWLLKGEHTAANRLTTVRVLNGCRSRKTTEWVAEMLEAQEFEVVRAGRAREEAPLTRIEGRGRHRSAGQRVADALQVAAPDEWESSKLDPVVTVVVGLDQVPRAEAEAPL